MDGMSIMSSKTWPCFYRGLKKNIIVRLCVGGITNLAQIRRQDIPLFTKWLGPVLCLDLCSWELYYILFLMLVHNIIMIIPNLSWILLLPLMGLGLVCLIPADKTSLDPADLKRCRPFAVYPVCLGLCGLRSCGRRFSIRSKYSLGRPLWDFLSFGGRRDQFPALALVGSCFFCRCFGIRIHQRTRQRILHLLLITVIGTYGAFLSLDIFFFYFFHEVAAVPVFLMIAIWGSERREFAAMKLTLYLVAGAAIALIGLLALYLATGLQTFDLVANPAAIGQPSLAHGVQNWIFPLIVVGFGITLTLWPFYTWAPVGYAEAPQPSACCMPVCSKKWVLMPLSVLPSN